MLITYGTVGKVVDSHLFDADPESTYHPDADPDPDPNFKRRLKLSKKC